MFGFEAFAKLIRLHDPKVSTLVQHPRTISYSIYGLSSSFLLERKAALLGKRSPNTVFDIGLGETRFSKRRCAVPRARGSATTSFCKCLTKKLDETKYFPISYHTVLDVLPGFLLDISRMKESI
jgi:hypothetical protein